MNVEDSLEEEKGVIVHVHSGRVCFVDSREVEAEQLWAWRTWGSELGVRHRMPVLHEEPVFQVGPPATLWLLLPLSVWGKRTEKGVAPEINTLISWFANYFSQSSPFGVVSTTTWKVGGEVTLRAPCSDLFCQETFCCLKFL